MAIIEHASGEFPVALITGASGGIGRAIFENLAEDHFVIGTSTKGDGAASLNDYLRDNKLSGSGMVLELSDPAGVEAWFKTVKSDFDIPRVLVNNAGVTKDNVMMTKKPDKLAEVMTVNFASPFELTRLTAMGLRKTGGSILNISSVVAYMSNPGQTAYAASKGAMDAAMRSAAAEYNGSPRINSLALGAVDTPMFRAAPQEFQDAIIGATDLGRAYTTEEIACAVRKVLFSSLNGQVVHMNSGLFEPNGALGHRVYEEL